jgi:hypothetical protein
VAAFTEQEQENEQEYEEDYDCEQEHDQVFAPPTISIIG